ncbi:hypothetical protein GC105_10745 [Alkalibaculum sp. M08DMB]|uniref:Uncharacterized protein n=1 Tax=Alkalibaculum sporogenes TaxID=2655001 RepID=A0A6A7KA81_9FIRM|nr:hypothetical protein [Alkalibaculum sporogenes]MPW26265.1 hypothetical protein [Alkalibaculum sporogenes]
MANLIDVNDSLNQGRVKLNTAIVQSEDAINKSTTALSNSESTQEQLNQVVIDGDSSVEAAQARVNSDNTVSYSTLKERLDTEHDAVTSNLTQISTNLVEITTKIIGEVNVKSYEHLKVGDDWTLAFDQLILDTPEGYKVRFPTDTYHGHFISNKSFYLDLQDSIIIPTDILKPVIKFEGAVESLPRNVTGNPVYGDTSFIINDVTGLAIDDIGYIVDATVRPSDGTTDINVELVKIKSINTTTKSITVYDMIRSHQTTGPVRFYKVDSVIKNPKVKNLHGVIEMNHNLPFVWFYGCENAIADNILGTNTLGHCVRFENCYNFISNNIRIEHPQGIGSGEGYGICALDSRNGYIEKSYGNGSRHVVDINSAYTVTIKDVKEVDSKSTPVVLAHNGFGGNISLDTLDCVCDTYAVVYSGQGITDFDTQIAHDIKIKNITQIVPTKKANEFNISVYIQADYDNVIIDNVKTKYIDTSVAPTGNSKVVRLTGNQRGTLEITNIKANHIGILVEFARRSTFGLQDYLFKLNGLQAETVHTIALLRGINSVDIDNVSSINAPINAMFEISDLANVVPFRVTIGRNIHTQGKIMTYSGLPLAGLRGMADKLNNGSTSGVMITDGTTLTMDKILTSGEYITLIAPVGADATLNSLIPFEAPVWLGQEMVLIVNNLGDIGTRGNVIIPSGSTTYADTGVTTTLTKGNAYKFKGYNGKWRKIL